MAPHSPLPPPSPGYLASSPNAVRFYDLRPQHLRRQQPLQSAGPRQLRLARQYPLDPSFEQEKQSHEQVQQYAAFTPAAGGATDLQDPKVAFNLSGVQGAGDGYPLFGGRPADQEMLAAMGGGQGRQTSGSCCVVM